MDRFERDEASALTPVAGRAPFLQLRELQRKVQSDACVNVDTNAYSVPWHLIGSQVTVVVHGGRVTVHQAGEVVAEHAELSGRRRRSVERQHLAGVVGVRPAQVQDAAAPDEPPPQVPGEAHGELQRPLEVYEAAIGGAF